MLVRYLPGFVVPSGSGREIAAVFALGRCRGRCASRRDRMRTTHLSLVVAAFCSRPRLQFARGCPTRPWCDTCTSYNGSSFSSFFPPLFFFCRLVLKKIPGILEQKMFAAACCMFTIKNSFFFCVSFSAKQSVCITGPHGDCIVSTKPPITVVVFMNAYIVWKRGRDDSTLSSLREYL